MMGKLTSVTVYNGTATLRGTAAVAGLGSGSNHDFTFVVQAGGPWTTARFTVSGLTIQEILPEGQVTVA